MISNNIRDYDIEFNKIYLYYSGISSRLESLNKDLSKELDKFINSIMFEDTIDSSNISEIIYIRDSIVVYETQLNYNNNIIKNG
jgi:hypothetical protein